MGCAQKGSENHGIPHAWKKEKIGLTFSCNIDLSKVPNEDLLRDMNGAPTRNRPTNVRTAFLNLCCGVRPPV
jgi:hypothetical protein